MHRYIGTLQGYTHNQWAHGHTGRFVQSKNGFPASQAREANEKGLFCDWYGGPPHYRQRDNPARPTRDTNLGYFVPTGS